MNRVARILFLVSVLQPAAAQGFRWYSQEQVEVRGAARGIAVGDFDGDGDHDFVGPARLYRNNGAALFTEEVLPGTSGAEDRGSAAGDVDGDGDLDIVRAKNGGFGVQYADSLLLGDGRGGFAIAPAAWFPWAQLPEESSVVLVDIDGDSDLDCALGRYDRPTRLMVNDGSGRFRDESSRLPGHSFWTEDLAVSDIDRDGDPDLILGNGGYARTQPNVIFLNRGNGVFDLGNHPAVGSSTQRIAVGDLNGDLFPDMVFGNAGSTELYLNDRSGRFVNASQQVPATPGFCGALTLADVDGDGDLDILRGGGADEFQLFVNDGAARFTDATARLVVGRGSGGFFYDVEYADFDGDGDGDILATFSAALRPRWGMVLSGATRHVAANEQLSPNKLVRYEFLGAPGNLMLAGISRPLPAPILLPGLGRWGLDPATFAPLPPIVLPASGQYDWWIRVPDVLALRGRHVSVQALDVPGTGTPHLTKFTDERIY